MKKLINRGMGASLSSMIFGNGRSSTLININETRVPIPFDDADIGC